ncbi:cytochrome c3 family protein [Alkalimarinus alittae]|uniref:Cytochrome c3 family protein n=1 Tax=Alkalimarinus alittae TaxID=2961619 RepID=A0ABY6N460_9ALTE|nr:cytochrome c3 family protein [Alkalimarinus alittae]UZE96911.1 cytochrome c3 family protein [Alkalimarinus alittae]
MRWPHFLIIQCLLILAVGAVVYAHKDNVIVFKAPPESLAQWYKPENKRQVWLHTMFSLRREMQAVKYYIETGDVERLDKWVNKLSEHYFKIGDMVPEWSSSLEPEAMLSLVANSKNRQFDEATYMLEKVSNSCDSCHQDFRVTTAMRFRAPDFSSIDITPASTAPTITPAPVLFRAHMNELTEQVNQIKIFSEDGLNTQALSAYAELSDGLTMLGNTCSDCHKEGSQVFPSDAIKQTMAKLEESLHGGTLKDQGRFLGTLAVQACATCHGTHRLAFDMRNQMASEQKWLELIKH